MLSGLKDYLRRKARGMRWRGCYPVLLPHFQVKGERLRVLGDEAETLPASVAEALRYCDGSRTLRQAARQAGVSASELIRQHDAGRIVLWPTPPVGDVGKEVRLIIVSPHPDDAALSACAVLNEGALVLDLFSRTAWWRFRERMADIELIQSVREAEERLMARLTGARLHMAGLPEALLRGYAMEDVFSAAVKVGDAAVLESIGGVVRELARAHPKAKWLLPLGVGRHVDHRVARDAALESLGAVGIAEDSISFYEDQPYAAAEGGVGNVTWQVPGRKLRPSGAAFPASATKRELLRVYWSQLTWSQIQQVEEYERRLGPGERRERHWELDD